MNRNLLIALAVVGGLSLYFGHSSDDELLAPSKAGRPARPSSRQANDNNGPASAQAGARDVPHASSPQRMHAGSGHALPKEALPPDVAANLVEGVRQWQARLGADNAATPGTHSVIAAAWGGMRPPPAPTPRMAVVQAPEPEPPPMAPRFPHAWVGRFNDEGEPPSSAAASAVTPSGPQTAVARAVLAGPQFTWVVRAGDVIEGQWRVDRIQDRTMSLTYLPLQQQQTVVMR